jgi:MFS family permease
MKTGEARWWLLPPGAGRDLHRLLAMRALRAFADGFVVLLLPVYLLALGFSPLQVGAIATATLLGSGAMVFALGLLAHRFAQRRLVLGACLLMTLSGLAFAALGDFGPLLLVAAVGTLNLTNGDTSVFSPLEQSMVAQAVDARDRTAVFARYALLGALAGSVGALFAVAPEWAAARWSIDPLPALKAMFVLYGLIGLVVFAVYRTLSPAVEPPGHAPSAPLVQSRPIVVRMAAVFTVDSFGSGFAVQSLVALWLFERFDASVALVGQVFFWAGVLSAASFLVAPWLARRIGLVNTMVFTHLPANGFLIAAAFMPTVEWAVAMLLLRYATSSMDVPARNSYVMAVVPPHERAAAASFTSVPRSLAAGVSPVFAGWMLGVSSFGWPLVIGGALKIGYDLLLLRLFRAVRPPEEETR